MGGREQVLPAGFLGVVGRAVAVVAEGIGGGGGGKRTAEEEGDEKEREDKGRGGHD